MIVLTNNIYKELIITSVSANTANNSYLGLLITANSANGANKWLKD